MHGVGVMDASAVGVLQLRTTGRTSGLTIRGQELRGPVRRAQGDGSDLGVAEIVQGEIAEDGARRDGFKADHASGRSYLRGKEQGEQPLIPADVVDGPAGQVQAPQKSLFAGFRLWAARKPKPPRRFRPVSMP